MVKVSQPTAVEMRQKATALVSHHRHQAGDA